jgi:hypothetical protein
MANKFHQFDVVRYKDSPDNLIVAEVEPGGSRYLLKQSKQAVTEVGWATEDELELVKKAYADVTGFGHYSH